MNILIVGTGGREYAIGWKLAQSPKAEKLFFAPGNAGTLKIGENLSMDFTRPDECVALAHEKNIDMVVVGRIHYLQHGVSEIFLKAGFKVFGPSRAAAEIECSKAFSKTLMKQLGIPTAEFKVFYDYASALSYVEAKEFPQVIKTDGPAFGEGVLIAKDFESARAHLDAIFNEKKFGEDGGKAIVEEYLAGMEVSAHAFCDGISAIMMPFSQDHKRLLDGDEGPNTAGLGAIAPVPGLPDNLLVEIHDRVIVPVLRSLKARGTPFVGVMYPGLMITKDGWHVLEINARFGDPEAQCYMRLLKTDLADIFATCIDGSLVKTRISWDDHFTCCVVLSAAGYPGEYKTGLPISGLASTTGDDNTVFFYGETKVNGNVVVTDGPRAMGVSAIGNTLADAVKSAYEGIRRIAFEGAYYRKDIGAKVLALDH